MRPWSFYISYRSLGHRNQISGLRPPFGGGGSGPDKVASHMFKRKNLQGFESKTSGCRARPKLHARDDMLRGALKSRCPVSAT
eukprot:scaffold647864_cov43-Prasinocladus_malaysianus.AAC.1